jgi:hypothetical protein
LSANQEDQQFVTTIRVFNLNKDICGQKWDMHAIKSLKHNQLFLVKCKLVKHKGASKVYNVILREKNIRLKM